MSKADDIRRRIDALVAAGTPRTEAFKQLAAELSIKYDSVRGAYDTAAKNAGGTPSRTRRRETTADDALADARAALERAMATIDREVEAAKTRADEAHREYEAQKASSTTRKAEIAKRLRRSTEMVAADRSGPSARIGPLEVTDDPQLGRTSN